MNENNIRNLPCVKGLKREIDYLENYLLDSPWKYKGEGKSIKPTLNAIRKHANEIIRLLLKKEAKEL